MYEIYTHNFLLVNKMFSKQRNISKISNHLLSRNLLNIKVYSIANEILNKHVIIFKEFYYRFNITYNVL